MKNLKIIFLNFVILVEISFAKVRLIFDERYQPCDGPKLGSDEKAILNGLDIDVEFYMPEDDESVMIANGSWTFKTNVESPWYISVTGEKFEMGEWHKRVVQTVDDACKELFNPVGMYYPFFKKQKRCPLKPGVSKFQVNI